MSYPKNARCDHLFPLFTAALGYADILWGSYDELARMRICECCVHACTKFLSRKEDEHNQC